MPIFKNTFLSYAATELVKLSTGQTHTHVLWPFSGTMQVSRYQKGKTNQDFTGARDSEWQWHQLSHMQVCTSLQTTTPTPHHSCFFYRPDALPAAQPTASKHWRHYSTEGTMHWRHSSNKRNINVCDNDDNEFTGRESLISHKISGQMKVYHYISVLCHK